MIELSDYTIAPDRTGNGLNGFDFSLSRGDFCRIRTDSLDDAGLFIKALATLRQPVRGTYSFMGETLDFSDYRSLLPSKKKIGYIGSDAAMISNMTIIENLLLMRHYYEDSLQLSLDERMAGLCRSFELEDILNVRPGEIPPATLRLAIAARELAKSSELLLLEYPEDYIGQANLHILMETLNETTISEMGIVFISEDRAFINAFSNRKVSISTGTLTIETN